MTRRRILILAAVPAVLVALLAASILALAPRLINTAEVKGRLLALGSRAIGGTVSYDAAELSWLPPRLVLRNVALSVPGKAEGTVPSLSASIRLLPLLRGKAEAAAIRADSPSISVAIPAKDGKAERPPPSLESVERDIADAVVRLAEAVPGLSVAVTGGRIDLYEGGTILLSLRQVGARLDLPPRDGEARAFVSCASEFWERVSLEAALDPSRFRGEGKAEARGLRPDRLAERLSLLPGGFGFASSPANVRVRLRAEGFGTMAAEVAADVPSLDLRRGGRSVPLRSLSLSGSVRADNAASTVSVSSLRIGDPGLSLAGTVVLGRSAPGASLDVEARDVEIPPVRGAALALGDDAPLLRQIFGIVRAGRLPTASFRSRAGSAAALFDLGNMAAQGRLEDGRIVVPGADLDLASVSADAALSEGTLSASGIAASLGKSRVRGGAFRLGLSGPRPPLHVDAPMEADLAGLPALLSRLVKDAAVRRELSRVTEFAGRATGRLILDGTTDAVSVRVTASEVTLSGRYGRIPFPVAIDGGAFRYDGDRVGVEGLGGRVGATAFRGLTARLAIGRKPALESLSGDLAIDAGEMFPWIAAQDGARETLRGIGKVEGTVRLSVSRLAGPLLDPKRWDFDASGEIGNLAVTAGRLPGPLFVTEGRFRAGPETVSVSGLLASLLDASLQASGDVQGYRDGDPRIDLSLNGVVGPAAVGRAADLLDAPGYARIRAPLAISGARLIRGRNRATALSGTAVFREGPDVRFTILLDPRGAPSRATLAVRDARSRADLSVDRRGDLLSLAFRGNLAVETMDGIFTSRSIFRGGIRADLRASVDRARPERSAVRGTLEVRDLHLPPKWAGPLVIRDLSTEAETNTIRVRRAAVTWLDQPFSLSGEARFSPDGFTVDADVSAEGIAVDRILDVLAERRSAGGRDGPPEARTAAEAPPPGGGSPEGAGGGKTARRIPLRGVVRLRAASVRWGRFEWKPLDADVVLADDGVKAAVGKADLCGFSTTGSVAVKGGELSYDLRVESGWRDLDSSLACLTHETENYRATGEVRLKARASGTGGTETFFKALRGDVSFEARNGRIFAFDLLAKTLSVLNVTEVVRGRVPDFGEGLAYRQVAIPGTLEGGVFRIADHAILDGTSVGIVAQGSVDIPSRTADLVLLVSPFRTADAVIGEIPIVGYIMEGHLVAVPVKVTGRFDAPDVTAMSPSEIGSQMAGILGRTLKVPFRIISPLIPGSKEEGTEAAP